MCHMVVTGERYLFYYSIFTCGGTLTASQYTLFAHLEATLSNKIQGLSRTFVGHLSFFQRHKSTEMRTMTSLKEESTLVTTGELDFVLVNDCNLRYTCT